MEDRPYVWDAQGKKYAVAARIAVSPNGERFLWLMSDGLTTVESDQFWRTMQIGGAKAKWKMLGWL